MERAAWDLIEALTIAGLRVSVLTTTLPDAGFLENEPVEITTIPRSRPGRYSLRWWLGVATADTHDIDAIISVSSGAMPLSLARRRPPVIMQVHGTSLRELSAVLRSRPRLWMLRAIRFAYWSMLDALQYRMSAAVVPIGPAVTAALMKKPYRGIWKRTILREIRNGVVTEPRDGVYPQPPVYVSVSRLDRQKGVDRLVDAMSRLEGRLVVIGDGTEREALERQVEELNLGNRVDFKGRLAPEAVRSTLSQASALVFLPRNPEREGLPLNVLEALAARRPVVTVPSDAWPKDLREELILVDVEDPDNIAHGCATAVARKGATLPDQYKIEYCAQRYVELLDEIGADFSPRKRRH